MKLADERYPRSITTTKRETKRDRLTICICKLHFSVSLRWLNGRATQNANKKRCPRPVPSNVQCPYWPISVFRHFHAILGPRGNIYFITKYTLWYEIAFWSTALSIRFSFAHFIYCRRYICIVHIVFDHNFVFFSRANIRKPNFTHFGERESGLLFTGSRSESAMCAHLLALNCGAAPKNIETWPLATTNVEPVPQNADMEKTRIL